MADSEPKMSQFFVRLLTGKTAILQFTTPGVYADLIKQRIFEITRIPIDDQRLICSGRQLVSSDVIAESGCTIHLLLRLVGGKGGFGSLLRGAATKAGQKKTNNFDACRDMNGRRLRHVNAEKRLEEWRAEEEERRLEKVAEEFIKKTAKKGKKGVGDGAAEKYVEKYREESAKCVAIVEESVREAMGGGKRKGAVPATKGMEAKRLKIWMGKRKMAESDSDDSSDEENEKSVVLDNGSHSDTSKEAERSSGSITSGKKDGDSHSGGLCESSSEGEKEFLVQESMESGGSPDEEANPNENGVIEPVLPGENMAKSTGVPCSEGAMVSGTEETQVENQDCCGPKSGKLDEVAGKSQTVKSGSGDSIDNRPINAETSGLSESQSGIQEVVVGSSRDAIMEKPLNFDEYNSAADLEVLGMERLKSELQANGLKCGGTLPERAARLFLLKSTPVEKLPKKLLAKK